MNGKRNAFVFTLVVSVIDYSGKKEERRASHSMQKNEILLEYDTVRNVFSVGIKYVNVRQSKTK